MRSIAERFKQRDLYKEVCEERLKDSSKEIYQALEDTVGERYKRYGNASKDIYEEDHGDTYGEAVTSHQDLLVEIYAERSRQRDLCREIYEERLKGSSKEIYKAQEDAIWEKYKRYENASEDIHEQDHEDT